MFCWPNDALSQKNHEAGTFGGFGKREQTHGQTDREE